METVDVLGIGLGPANLGLAAAVSEQRAAAQGEDPVGSAVRAVFLERRDSFAWHPGMLLEGSSMQVSFLKDLATMRDPASPFTFLQYLTARGRLVDFINHQTFFPSRVEFSDYLSWVAEQVSDLVRYSRTVASVSRLDGEAADGARYLVTATTPEGTETYRTRSVVAATGLVEHLPGWAGADDLVAGGRVFHNHLLLERLAALPDPGAGRFLVVGSGQSAAEVVRHLHDRYGQAVVESVINSYGFVPADDSPFANRVFDPAAVDDFFGAPPEVRADLVQRHRSTNYSCVDSDLIGDLYRTAYQERVTGSERLVFTPATRVSAARAVEGGVEVSLTSRLTGEERTQTFTAVVLATGFRSRGLDGLADELGLPHEVTVARDYRVEVDGEPVPGLFVQGATETTHGLGSTLLSNVAVRSGELLDTLLTVEARQHRVPAAHPA